LYVKKGAMARGEIRVLTRYYFEISKRANFPIFIYTQTPNFGEKAHEKAETLGSMLPL
jgi:hypothetical protein